MPLSKALISNQLSPVQVYGALRRLPYPILLESAMRQPDFGRYSFASADPFLIYEVKNGQVMVNGHIQEGNPLDILRQLLEHFKLPREDGMPPFTGGAAGFFSYDLGRLFEKLPQRALDDINMPDCMLCFYDTVIAFDHEKNETVVFSSGFPEQDAPRRIMRASDRLKKFIILAENTEKKNEIFAVQGEMQRHFDHSSYCRAVKQVKEYILSGDIYQVNLSQRFSLPFSGSPYGLYKKLSAINPAPFASLFEWKDFSVVSSSPERFLQLASTRVETRPIKGTRPRGKSLAEDTMLRDELWNSSKDRAELTMIVDLERNDLGRVCTPGTVQVPELFRLEKYATVWHLVSTVQGRLKEGLGITDLIKSTFPGGSITGAPKIRAMEIIEELEPVKRGVYTGSIGYLGFDGSSDLNIVIRTFVIKNGTAHIQVGGGITIDSDPEAEYQETLDKARALFNSLGLKEEG